MAYGRLSEERVQLPPVAENFFTDREEPRKIFEEFFARLYARKVRGETGNEAPLLSFYGVGGVGKTTLLEKARSEFVRQVADNTDASQVHVALLDLAGLPLGKHIPAHELLWKVRNVLLHDQLRTPLFDSVYALVWQEENPGQKLEMPRATAQDWFDIGIDNLAELADSGGVLKWARMLWDKAKNNIQRQRIERISGGSSPLDWDHRKRLDALPDLLWMDITQAFEKNPLLRVALLIDEFEKIQANKPIERGAERTLVGLLGELFFTPQVCDRLAVVAMGREKLRWDATYDPVWSDQSSDSKERLIESHILGGLSVEDARVFLREKISPWFKTHGESDVAQVLSDYEDEIIALTQSDQDHSGRAYCLPFHLDLVVKVARDTRKNFSPELLAPQGQDGALEDRFLRYLKQHDERRLAALQALAMCQSFDKSVFDYLVSNQVIGGYSPHQFWEVLGGDEGNTDSFIKQHPSLPGYFIFLRQMQMSLANSLLKTSYGTVGEKERLDKVIAYYVERSQFPTPADFSAEHRLMFTLGVDVLKSKIASGLLSPEKLFEATRQLAASFDDQMATSLLRPFLGWSADFCEKKFGLEHPNTLTAMSYLASVLYAQGDLPGARALQEKVVSVRERVLGAEHPDTLTAMSHLANALYVQGDLPGARALQEKVVSVRERVLGAEHPDTLKAMHNLASALYAQGDLPGARGLEEKVLSVSERVLDAEHPDTLTAMNNLAFTSQASSVG